MSGTIAVGRRHDAGAARGWGRIGAIGSAALLGAALALSSGGCPTAPTDNGNTNANDNTGGGANARVKAGTMVVLGYNDLGMHCMNEDFSELMILPPFNTLHAQVIQRGEEPRLVTGNVTVRYSIENNTTSADKTNFWTYAPALLGVTLEPNVGLAGNSLSGVMKSTGDNDWSAIGIPVTPLDDDGKLNAYNLASVVVSDSRGTQAETLAVVPVSWEIRCDLCHNTPGISPATDILRKHDTLHGTSLESAKPVMCASCHADVALGAAGDPARHNLSRAMHGAHASRMNAVDVELRCYACHPGQDTRCLRDVHYERGMICTDCHDSMTAVADAARRPWIDEPQCSSCHQRAGFDFEQPGTLYRNSKGHGNVHCAACHGSPHAITPTVVAADNIQAIGLQGHAGTIDTCTVCHIKRPDEGFFHRAGGEGEGGE